MTPTEAVAEIRKALRALSEMGELPDRFVHSSGIVILFNQSLSEKRAAAGRKGGARSVEARREAFGSAMPPKQTRSKPEASDSPDSSEANGVPSPTPPLSPSGSESSPENSSSLSASSGSESKRARRTKRAKPPGWKFVPESWQPNQKHVEFAKTQRLNLTAELAAFRDWEFKDPKTDADRAFMRWLREAPKYGSTQQNASSRDGVPIVKHPVFRPEPPIPASERPSQSEITQMLSKVGRVAT